MLLFLSLSAELFNCSSSSKCLPLLNQLHLGLDTSRALEKSYSLKSRQQQQSRMAISFFLTWLAERLDSMLFSDFKNIIERLQFWTVHVIRPDLAVNKPAKCKCLARKVRDKEEFI